MASLLPAASAAASVTKTSSLSPSSSSSSSLHSRNSSNVVSFRLSSNSKSKLWFSPPRGLQANWNHSTLVKAQLNEVANNGSSNTAETPVSKSEGSTLEEKDVKPVDEPSPPALASEDSISEFVKQVASLVKLVDSRDIVELQLKHLDCELIIRKTEALPQPQSPAPVVLTHSPSPSATMPSPFPPVAAPTPSAPTPTPAHAPPPAAKPSKPSHPPLKCPMAGTFYRSPGPNEPPFVKVGDKVQKGQVLCIIEAMKLMNDIEADQSGTIVEILVEDAKPVSVDQPLFLIEP